MYTPFEGAALLDAFLSARLGILRQLTLRSPLGAGDGGLVSSALALIDRRLARHSPGVHDEWRLLVDVDHSEQNAIQVPPSPVAAGDLARFSPDREVSTSALLRAVVCSFSEEVMQDEARVWLDRLVQRFEVTKRLYEKYPTGFRKGAGDFDCLWRYWMLGLALCICLAEERSLRLLNTLLKVCDLLCSVDINDLRKAVPDAGMRMVLAMEAVSIHALMIDKDLLCAAI
jgi:hypothetical protein